MRFKYRLSALVCCLVMMAASLAHAGYATLRPGDEGDRVTALQQTLIGLGYPIEVDGKYGRRTQVAVTAFQRTRGLNTDGVAGPQTLEALLGGGALPAVSAPAPQAPAVPEGAPVFLPQDVSAPAVPDVAAAQAPQALPGRYELGSAGQGVVSLQQRLLALGYDCGRIDGVFDAGTQKAVRAYQRAKGLSVDGIAGRKTLASLYAPVESSAPQPAAPQALPQPQMPVTQVSGQATVATGNTGGLRLRSSMSSKGSRNVIASLRNGQQVNILGVQGEWVQVEAGIHLGYVISRFLQVGALPPQAPAPQPPVEQQVPQDATPGEQPLPPAPVQTAVTQAAVHTPNGGSLRLRSSMDSRSGKNVLRTLPNGAALQVLSQGPQWSQVQSDGQLGYVMSRFLQFAPVAQPVSDPQVPADAAPQQDDEGPLFPRTLRAGDSGQDVSALQSRLEALRYAVRENGVYDEATAQAVRQFQQQNNVSADGVFGPLTAQLLLSPTVQANQQALPDFTTLRMGSEDGGGRAVTMLQTALQGLGFQLAVDGTFGPKTHDAVVAFQQRNNLTVSGEADPETQKLLYAGGANGAAVPVATPDVGAAIGKGPNNADVKLLDWDTEVKPQIKSGQVAQVYHPESGISFDLRYYSLGRHADSEPLTLKDTQLMNQALGETSWDTRTVYVKMPSGEWTMATMHNYPHLYGSVKDNGFSGHLCVHFKRDLEETKKVSPKYGMQNQLAIRKSWQQMTGVAVN